MERSQCSVISLSLSLSPSPSLSPSHGMLAVPRIDCCRGTNQSRCCSDASRDREYVSVIVRRRQQVPATVCFLIKSLSLSLSLSLLIIARALSLSRSLEKQVRLFCVALFICYSQLHLARPAATPPSPSQYNLSKKNESQTQLNPLTNT